MAVFDKKQAPGSIAPAAPKVDVSPAKDARASAPASGYDSQRAALTPTSGGYASQRAAVTPAVPSLGGIELDALPQGPQNEPRKKKKKKKKKQNQTNTNANGGGTTVQPTPQPAPQPTVQPAPQPTEPQDQTATPAPAPAPAPAKKLEPMQDPSVNPDPTNEYAANATYTTISGTIAVQGEGDANAIDANDVKQGSIGNCYFVAQLAAQAKADPSVIENLIKDNGDGSYTVSLYLKDARQPWKRTKTDVVIDSKFPSSDGRTAAYAKPGDSGSNGPELWVMLIEKAFAKHAGHYEETRGKKTKDADVFGMMTGVTSGYRAMSSLSDDALIRLCEAAVKAGKPVSFGAINTSASDELQKGAKEAGVVLNHAYSLEGVDAGKRTLSLRNPWGVKHLFDTDVAVVRKFYDGVRVAG